MKCTKCNKVANVDSDLVEVGEQRLCLKCYIDMKVAKGEYKKVIKI